MNFLPFRPEEADLYIAMKRARALGYIESHEPLAKRLKYEDVDMEIEGSDNEQRKQDLPFPKVLVKGTVSPHKKETPKVKDIVPKVNGQKTSKNPESKKPNGKRQKDIDETTYRNWYVHTPLSSGGITYVMYTPPPTCRTEVNLLDLPKNPVTDLDREPWKTASISWYDPLYGDLVAPTGTYDAIRTLLKDTRRVKRKPML